MFGSVAACVTVPLGGVVTVGMFVVTVGTVDVIVGAVVVRRGGGVVVICDEVVVEPLASAPAGTASEIPTEAMAAANLVFTGFRNVDERRLAPRPDEILRNMRAFFKR